MSGGRVVDRLVTLLSPPVGWDHFEFSYLHGISAEHTRGAPDWGQVAGQVACFTASLPVFAHNAQFDARVWRQLDDFFATSSYPERFYCTYRTAQWLIPGLPNYRLPTVTRVCAPDFVLNHHRADSDAEACAMIVAALQVRARHR